jgi:capsular polysaccharide biosynthesis protein
MTGSQLAGMIAVSSPPETRILEITVKNGDPELAKKLADALADVSAKYMVSIMEMERVNVIEQGNLPTAPFSPDIMNNAFLGGFVGCILAVVFIIILFLINDSIKTTEDIEKYLNLTTLGTIPLIDSKIIKKRKKLRKREAAKAG